MYLTAKIMQPEGEGEKKEADAKKEWTPDQHKLWKQCVAVLEQAIADGKEDVEFTWDHQKPLYHHGKPSGPWIEGSTPSLAHVMNRHGIRAVDEVFDELKKRFHPLELRFGGFDNGTGVCWRKI